MRAVRRLLFPLHLAGSRLAHGRRAALLLALGVATGAAALAVVLGGSLVAQDRSTARALARIAPADRTIHVAYSGIPKRGVDRSTLEPTARRAIASLGRGEPVHVVQFKLLRFGGAFVNLGAIDGARSWIRLRSGRLPRTCTPERCEVVKVGGGAGRIPSAPGVRLVPVGEGSLASPVPFGRLQGAEGANIGQSFALAEDPPFVLAEGVSALTALRPLESLYRTYAWVLPLEPGSVRLWDVDAFTASVTRAGSTLEAASINFDVVAPTAELEAAAATGRVAGRRLLVIGGQVAALLLAFAVLAAATMRREASAARERLVWRGARRWQLAVVSAAEAAAVALAGAVLGWAVGVALTGFVAREAGSPAGAILSHSVLASQGAAAAALVALVSTFVLLLALRSPAIPFGRRAVSTLDVAALGALLAVALALVRGEADVEALAAGEGTGTLLLVLPGLLTFVVAVAAARVVVPVLRLLQRVAARASVPVRLAALSLARAPGQAAIAVTFLSVSVGLALFATAYRSTLSGGMEDVARYAVPADVVLREDVSAGGLVAPLEAAPLARYENPAPGVRGIPVIRQEGSASALGTQGRFTLLAVPRYHLEALDGWRDDFSDVSLAEIERRLDFPRTVLLRGVAIPEDTRALRLPAGVRGGAVGIDANVLTTAGDFATVRLGEVPAGGERTLRARLPAGVRGGRLVAFSLRRPLVVEGHSEFARLDGVLRLGRLVAETPSGRVALVTDYGGWTGANGVDETTGGREATVRFLFGTQTAGPRFEIRQPAAAHAVPVVASPRLAAAADADGILPLRLPGGQLRTRVVAVAERFPSTEGEFVLADEPLVFAALNAQKPGAAVPNEIWLAAESAPAAREAAALADRPPFDVLEAHVRADLERDLRGDPLARGAILVLAAAAAVALLLAAVGLALLLVSDARDERGELFDLEAQGLTPRELARHLRLRALLVVGLGLLGGLVAGGVLAVLVVDVVAVTATATAAEPPLVLAIDWPLLAALVAGYAVAAALIVGVLTRAPFRSPYPVRVSEEAA